MRIAQGLRWSQHDDLLTAYHHFKAGLRRDLSPPSRDGLTEFIKQVQLRQEDWFQIYSTYGKSRPPNPFTSPSSSQPRPNQPIRTQYPSQSKAVVPYRPPQPQPKPPEPRVYYADEEDDDSIYDSPTDSWYVAPAHPPGHTPRRQGNTHDHGYGSEAIANWSSAGEDRRCSYETCTHYH